MGPHSLRRCPESSPPPTAFFRLATQAVFVGGGCGASGRPHQFATTAEKITDNRITDMTKDTATLTPKQEKFCLKYIETGNATEAYYASYDAKGSKPITANRAAKELLDNPKIAARVRALHAEHQKRHEVTVDSITNELELARNLAHQQGQASAAVSASLGKAKLHGLIVEKNEHTGKNGEALPAPVAVQIYIPSNGRDKH